MKLGIIIGHEPTNPGALGYNGKNEFEFNFGVCKHLMYDLKMTTTHDSLFFWRTEHLQYSANIADMTENIAAWKPDFCIELHFNSFRKDVVTLGSTAVVLTDRTEPLRFAKIFQEHLFNEYQIKKRFIQSIGSTGKGRGLRNLTYLRAHNIDSVILEPCFGNTRNRESVQILNNPKGYAYTLRNIIVEAFGL